MGKESCRELKPHEDKINTAMERRRYYKELRECKGAFTELPPNITPVERGVFLRLQLLVIALFGHKASS